MISLIHRTDPHSSPTLRRGFFMAPGYLYTCYLQHRRLITYVLLSYFLISNSSILASATHPLDQVQGFTLDPDGQPIPFVSLIFQHANIALLSDAEGAFSVDLTLLQEDSIAVRRIGYQDRIISTYELRLERRVQLSPTVLPLASVQVQATAVTLSGLAQPAITSYNKPAGSGVLEQHTMLQRIPGITIRSYGGPAGISTLSMDGGPSSHTRVLWEDIELNSAQNGEADLSQLPLPLLESMQYIPFDISQDHVGGSDGTIKLGSSDHVDHITASSGSFGHRSFDLNLGHQFSGIWTALQVGRRQEAGDYPVAWNGQQHPRANNDLDQKFASLHYLSLPRPDLFLRGSVMVSRQSRGVAGLLWSPDTRSHRDDQLLLAGTTLGWVHARGHTQCQVTLRNSVEHYSNPYLNIDSHHRVSSIQSQLKDKHTLSNSLTLFSMLNVVADNIASSATDDHQRLTGTAALTPVFQPASWISLIPAFKIHFSPGLYQQTTTNLQLRVNPVWGPLSNLALSRGDIYKYPSFNDLYWTPGGNPNLKPELTSVTTAQLRFDLRPLGTLLLQWQHKASDNLIQWMPVHSYWQPGNIQSASRESRKLVWQLEQPRWDLAAFAHLSLINTRDHDRDKRLRYAPDRTAAAGLTWSPDLGEFTLQYSAVSERISMYDYPVDTILKATELWYASLGHNWDLNHGSLILVLAIDNLTNVSYETIRGYPEPGRTFRLSTTFSFNPQHLGSHTHAAH